MKKCKNCSKIMKKEEYPTISINSFNKIKFCSIKCYSIWRSGRYITNKIKKGNKKCLYCKKNISISRNYKRNKFCCKKCSNIWKKGKHMGTNRKINYKKCIICNNRIKKQRKKYCSIKCYKVFLKKSFNQRYGKKKANKIKNKIRLKNKNISLKKIIGNKSYQKWLNSVKKYKGKTYEEIMKDKEKIKKRLKKLSGKNSLFYIHGMGYEPYDSNFNNRLKIQIKKRDKYICKLCGKRTYNGVYHHIHYIKKYSRQKTLVYLHNKCNLKVNRNRDFYFSLFSYILNQEPEEVFI